MKQKKSTSWCRVSWPAQGPSCAPDLFMRRSTSEPAAQVRPETARPALPLACKDKATASGTGHFTRSRPQDSAVPSRHMTKDQRAS